MQENLNENYGKYSEIDGSDVINVSNNEKSDFETGAMTIATMFDEMSGLDEFGYPKTSFSIEIGEFDSRTEEGHTTLQKSFYGPVLNLIRTPAMTMIDIVFETKVDADLRILWNWISKYGTDMTKALTQGLPVIPTAIFNFVPNKHQGKYALTCVSPAYWTLEPDFPTGEVKTLRLVFTNDTLQFIQTEGFNTQDVVAELEREDAAADAITEMIERKREEEEEYQEYRNKLTEEMRKNKML